MVNYRVGISGQFYNNALVCKQTIQINRDDIPLQSQPSNWITFCDEVDEYLHTLEQEKKVQFNTIIISTIIFTINVIVFFFLNIADSYKSVIRIVLSIALLVILFLAYHRIKFKIRHVFGFVEQVCVRHSVPNVVLYKIDEETNETCTNTTDNKKRIVTVEMY